MPIITISGAQAPMDTTYWSPVAAMVYARKMNSPVTYRYPSGQQMRFEMEMRAAIVAAAEALSVSGIRFSDFKNARCNEQFWFRTETGGFRIRDGISPAMGIRDIFVNGGLYATECAIATIIVVYKGVLDSIREVDFNSLFSGLLLYDWQVDDDLRLLRRTGVRDSYPGDLLYFSNPDVSPDTPQWQGENVVKIAENVYYGHPVGIIDGQTIIAGLNSVRRPGATRSAYLTDDVVYPDYAYLSQFAHGLRRKVIARIGGRRYVY